MRIIKNKDGSVIHKRTFIKWLVFLNEFNASEKAHTEFCMYRSLSKPEKKYIPHPNGPWPGHYFNL